MKKHLLLVLALALLMAGVARTEERRQDGWERTSPYNKLYNRETVETLKGKVVAVDRECRPMHDMGPGVCTTIQTAAGRRVECQVGPAWFTQFYRDEWKVAVGDQVEIQGSIVKIDGHEVMMVKWGRKGEHMMTLRNSVGEPIWDPRIEGF